MNKKKFNKYYEHNDIQLFRSGNHLLEIIEQAILGAKRQIHFQVYILEEDESSYRIVNALKAAAHKGVKVYMLIDAIGSKSLSFEFVQDLRNHGILFEWFNPFIWSKIFQYAYRLHQKVITIDQKLAIVGGFNISNDYLGSPKHNPWLDFGIIIRGEIVPLLIHICKKAFESNSDYKLPDLVEDTLNSEGKMKARVSWNNFLQRRFAITYGYRKAIRQAKKEIVIVHGYFLPNKKFLRLLIRVVRRGIQVKLILPKKSDVPIFHWATQYLYHYLLKNQIEIYEWRPAVLHAKIVVVDNIWCTIGSYNLNYTSILGNLELNLEILDRGFSTQAHKLLEEVIEQESLKIEWDEIQKSAFFWKKVRSYIAYKCIVGAGFVMRCFGFINRVFKNS